MANQPSPASSSASNPADHLPQYVIDGVDRQAGDALDAVIEYAEHVRERDTDEIGSEAEECLAKLPAYVVDGINRRDDDELEAVIEYARSKRTQRTQSPDPNEIAVGRDERLVTAAQKDEYTEVIKKVTCGKECSGCPHGPYVYRVTYSAAGLDWEYRGPLKEMGADG